MNKRRSSGIGSSGGRSGKGFPGAHAFVDLSDVPNNYTGKAGDFVTVKATEKGLEFTPLPPLVITDTYVVNSQADMLLLAAQTGDIAIRTDISQSFILSGTGDPTILANWYMLLVSPTHAIGGALHTADTLAHLKSKISAPDTLLTSDAGEIAAYTAKGTPIAADLIVIEDSADTNKKKKITIGTLPAAAPAAHAIGGALHTADTIANIQSKVSDGFLLTSAANEFNGLTAKLSSTVDDRLVIEDFSDTNKKKAINISVLPFPIRGTTVDITFSDLSAAALTNSILLYSLPAAGIIIGTRLKAGVIFSGPAITSYFLSLGVAGNTADIMNEYDVKNITVSDTEYAEAMAFQSFNYNASTSILITARSIGANLSAANQGSAKIEVYYIPRLF
jgi:hypothetical protein